MRLRLTASLLALVAGVVAVIVVALLLVPIARADGDPASDWLLGRSSYIPPDSGISTNDQKVIVSMLSSARAQGYPLRLAVIATRYDLGSVTVLFNRPTDYAPFLSEELSFVYKKRVLVVMPHGYAIARNGKRDPAEQSIVAGMVPPKPFQGAPLTASVEHAIRTLASRAGIVLPATPKPSGGGSSSTRDRILIVIGAGVLMLLSAGLSFGRRRARSAPGRSR